MQHGMVSFDQALSMLQAIAGTDTLPLARAPSNDPASIMKLLDSGVAGIICPLINTKKEAQQFVDSCLYPPEGLRSFGPLRGLIYGGSDYTDYSNDEILKFAMIETKEALEKLDEIMSTPGVDGIYIGPADLSFAIDQKPSFDNQEGSPQYEQIVNILKHAKKNNIVAGIHNSTPEYAQKMIDLGFQLVTVGSDQNSMSKCAKSDVLKLKKMDSKKGSKTY